MLVVASVLASAAVLAQGTVTSADLLKPSGASWPMYNGDYSGRRFSPLTRIDTSTVSSLTLAWVYRPNPGNAPAGGGGQTVVTIKGTPVVANGVMYVSIPDHLWAVDARSGRELWHATWEGDESDIRRIDPENGAVLERLEMPRGAFVSGLESDGADLFYAGGGASGKVRAVRRPKRTRK